MWERKIKNAAPFTIAELAMLPDYAFQFFFKYCAGFRREFFLLTGVGVASALLRFTGLYILSHVISHINELSFAQIASDLFPLWIGAFVLSECLDYFIRKYGEALPIVYTEYTSLRFYLSFASLRSGQLLNYSKEKLFTLTNQYTQHVRHFLSDWTWGLTFRGTRLVLIVVILYMQSPYVLAVTTLFVFCLLLVALQISARFAVIAKRYSEQQLETGSTISSFMMNLNALKRLQAQELFKQVAQALIEKNWIELERVRRFHAGRWLFQLNLFNFLYAATLLYGIYQVKRGELELGFLLFIKWSFDELWNVVVYCIEYYVQLVQERQDAAIVRREFSALTDGVDRRETLALAPEQFRSLTMRDVELEFAQEGGSVRRLKIAPFTLNRGARIGLVGESGSGKTTLLGVLLNLIPFRGSYMINGLDARSVEFPPTFITMVSAVDPLFKLSLRQNITLGKTCDECTLQRVLEGCLVSEFAPNIDVEVGSRHFNLSAGQEQRVRLARGLLQGGEIFLFDEIFNGIDGERKEKIIDFLLDYLRDKTVILVTHNRAELRLIETVHEARNVITVHTA